MNMIERVARALWMERLVKGVWNANKPSAEPFLREARAAIKAMREPTEAMMDAGNSARVASKQIDHNTAATWESMIDAALQEDGE